MSPFELHLKLWHPNERHGKWQRLKGFKTRVAAERAALRFPAWATKIVEVESA